MTITYAEAMQIRATFLLTYTELSILVAVLEGSPLATRDDVRRCAHLAGHLNHVSERSFDVSMSRLNKKLPERMRVVTRYGEGGRYAKGVTLQPAVGFAFADHGAYADLMAIARAGSIPEQERQAA